MFLDNKKEHHLVVLVYFYFFFNIISFIIKSIFPLKANDSSISSPSVLYNAAPQTVLQDSTAPLWMAAQMGHSETVRVLLLRGADRDAERHVKYQL